MVHEDVDIPDDTPDSRHRSPPRRGRLGPDRRAGVTVVHAGGVASQAAELGFHRHPDWCATRQSSFTGRWHPRGTSARVDHHRVEAGVDARWPGRGVSLVEEEETSRNARRVAASDGTRTRCAALEPLPSTIMAPKREPRCGLRLRGGEHAPASTRPTPRSTDAYRQPRLPRIRCRDERHLPAASSDMRFCDLHQYRQHIRLDEQMSRG